MLHHLRSPARALAECARVLRPHGVALFFEPFLGGNRIVAATFQALLDLDQGRPPRPSRRLPKGVASFIQRLKVLPPGSAGLVPDVAQCLTGVCRDFAIRASMNRLTVRLRRVDDKWLFERRFFASAARRHGFLEPVVFPLRESPRLFSEHMRSLLHLVLGKDEGLLPPWASEVVDGVDDHLTAETRQANPTECGIVLTKR